MSEVQNQIKKWPVTAIKKIKNTFGSAEKFYATVYLIARNEHHCQMMGVAGAEQRLKTIHAYQAMIRFMLDEEGLNGKEVLEAIASDYLEDFVNYRKQDFGMTNDVFIAIIKRIG